MQCGRRRLIVRPAGPAGLVYRVRLEKGVVNFYGVLEGFSLPTFLAPSVTLRVFRFLGPLGLEPAKAEAHLL